MSSELEHQFEAEHWSAVIAKMPGGAIPTLGGGSTVATVDNIVMEDADGTLFFTRVSSDTPPVLSHFRLDTGAPYTITGTPVPYGVDTVGVSGSVEITNDVGNAIPVSATTLPLPTSAATADKQDTGNTTLSYINDKLPTTLGQKTKAASLSVTLASTDDLVNLIKNSGTNSTQALAIQGVTNGKAVKVETGLDPLRTVATSSQIGIYEEDTFTFSLVNDYISGDVNVLGGVEMISSLGTLNRSADVYLNIMSLTGTNPYLDLCIGYHVPIDAYGGAIVNYPLSVANFESCYDITRITSTGLIRLPKLTIPFGTWVVFVKGISAASSFTCRVFAQSYQNTPEYTVRRLEKIGLNLTTNSVTNTLATSGCKSVLLTVQVGNTTPSIQIQGSHTGSATETDWFNLGSPLVMTANTQQSTQVDSIFPYTRAKVTGTSTADSTNKIVILGAG